MDTVNTVDKVDILLYNGLNEILVENFLIKSVLKQSCRYFDRLFTNFKEQFEQTIKIKVPVGCVKMTFDIIMTFFGVPLPISIFNVFVGSTTIFLQCCDYFEFRLCKKYLQYMVIDNNNFELLLNVLRLEDYDDTVVEYVSENIPKDFSGKIDKILVKQILAKPRFKIITFGRKNITMYDTNGKIIDSSIINNLVEYLKNNKLDISDIIILPNGQKMIIACINSIFLICLEKGQLINQISTRNSIDHILCTPDSLKIITANYMTGIEIFDADNGSIIRSIPTRLINICLSPCNKRIVTQGFGIGCDITHWNLETGEKIFEIRNYKIYNFFISSYSADSSKILLQYVGGDGYAYLITDESKNDIRKVQFRTTNKMNNNQYKFKISPNGSKMVCFNNKNEILYMDTNKIFEYHNDDKNVFSRHITYSNLIFDVPEHWQNIIDKMDDPKTEIWDYIIDKIYNLKTEYLTGLNNGIIPIKNNSKEIYKIEFTPDNQKIIFSNKDGCIKTLDLLSKQIIGNYNYPKNHNNFIVSPDFEFINRLKKLSE